MDLLLGRDQDAEVQVGDIVGGGSGGFSRMVEGEMRGVVVPGHDAAASVLVMRQTVRDGLSRRGAGIRGS